MSAPDNHERIRAFASNFCRDIDKVMRLLNYDNFCSRDFNLLYFASDKLPLREGEEGGENIPGRRTSAKQLRDK